jgi:hypothetical protein
LRILLWKNLRALYEAYVSGRTLEASDQILRGLITAIVGELSETEMIFLLTGLFELDASTVEFNPFACHFLYLVSQLGLSRFKQNQVATKKNLNKHEFVTLFKNTYSFLKISKLKDEYLWLHFAKIDKDQDGLISYEEYLDWIKRFIAVVQYFGDEFWFEDDDENSKYDMFEV